MSVSRAKADVTALIEYFWLWTHLGSHSRLQVLLLVRPPGTIERPILPASLRARVCRLACMLPVGQFARVSAVKVWLRDCSGLAGGIQAKAPAPHPAHQFLCLATMPFRHCSDGLRGDVRGTAEQ
jgi:hypothetical protein